MEFISVVDKNIYFGKYPNKEILNTLLDLKIDTVINLTHFLEDLPNYILPETVKRVDFSIPDFGIEEDDKVERFITYILNNLLPGNIYIHCKGGHGRSGTIAALLYGKIYNKNGEESLNYIRECHEKRKSMSRRMRFLGSPQSTSQKEQVLRLLG